MTAVFNHHHDQPVRLGALEVRAWGEPLRRLRGQLPALALLVRESKGALDAQLRYDADLFSAPTIDALVARLDAVVAEALA